MAKTLVMKKNRLKMKRIVWGAVATTVVLIGIVVAGALLLFEGQCRQTYFREWPAISWRAQIYLKKAYGGIPELSWSEL